MAQSGYDVVMLISGLSDHSSNVVIIFSESVDPSVTHETVLYLAVVQLVKYRTRNQEVAGLTHTRSTASNLEQAANLLCAQANSAFYPQLDGK